MRHILTITGASGAGKDTLLDGLLVLNGAKPISTVYGRELVESCYKQDSPTVEMRELISHTTRKPRQFEHSGLDYYFVDEDFFKTIKKVEEVEYAGNHYCLSEDELYKIPDDGWGVVIVDQTGVRCLKEFVDAHRVDFRINSVFLTISEETSRERMTKRGDAADSIEARIKQQKERNEYSPKCPYYYNLVLKSDTCDDYKQNIDTVQEMLINGGSY